MTKQQHFSSRVKTVLKHIHGELIPEGADYGQIHPNEAEFLLHGVLNERPKCIAEIGTAAGVSTSYMMSALEIGDIDASLTAIECLEHCYFDPTKNTCFILDSVYPVKPSGFRLLTGVSSLEVGEHFAKEEIDFLFIDANHTHPWSTLDTIFALPFLSPGALVVYHDINLQYRGGVRKKDHTGPHFVFYNLPAEEKVVVGEFPYPNIGSLRITTTQEETLINLLDILFQFEWRPGAWPEISGDTILKIRSFILSYWGEKWANIFVEKVDKYVPLLSRHSSE